MENVKFCFRCQQAKSLEHFGRHKGRKDGLNPRCRPCAREEMKIWKEKNPERRKEIVKKSNEVNRESRKISNAKYRVEKADVKKASSDAYRKRHLERIKIKNSTWAKLNRHLKNASKARYLAAKAQRTPKWLTQKDIDLMKFWYEFAAAAQQGSGIPHHVDHIIPLRGKLVSGLHVPGNLQILKASDNCRKCNHWTPE